MTCNATFTIVKKHCLTRMYCILLDAKTIVLHVTPLSIVEHLDSI